MQTNQCLYLEMKRQSQKNFGKKKLLLFKKTFQEFFSHLSMCAVLNVYTVKGLHCSVIHLYNTKYENLKYIMLNI